MKRFLPLVAIGIACCGAAGAYSALPIASGSDAERAQQRAAQFDKAAQDATSREGRATLEAAALAARVQQAEAGLHEAEQRQHSIAAKRGDLDTRLARQRAPTLHLMTALGTLSRRPPVLMLFQPGSLADMAHLRAVTAAIGPQIDARAAGVRQAIRQSDELASEAQASARRQLALRSELAQRREALLSAAAAERLAAQRAAGAADREAERAFAIAEQSRTLGTLAQNLRPKSPGTAAARAGSPQFLPPVAAKFAPTGPNFGRGATFRGGPGALVVAPAAGRVLFAGPYRGFGAIVIIDHGGGWTSLVTGLGKSEVRVGQQVLAGSPLGQAGGGGGEIGWELRSAGAPVDPAAYLVR